MNATPLTPAGIAAIQHACNIALHAGLKEDGIKGEVTEGKFEDLVESFDAGITVPPVPFPTLVTVAGVRVHADKDAQTVFYQSLLNVDGDGGPHCYSRLPGQGLDYLANAGHPGNWYGILTDAHGIPIIQGANDPAPGYYISTTSIVDPAYPATDPRRYANSEAIAYLACAAQLFESSVGVKIGDVATVSYGDKTCHAIVADTGNTTSLGEGSIYLAQQLGLCDNPKGSGDAPMPHDVRYVIHLGTADLLPGGKMGRLLSQDEIDARATAALASRGVDVGKYFV